MSVRGAWALLLVLATATVDAAQPRILRAERIDEATLKPAAVPAAAAAGAFEMAFRAYGRDFLIELHPNERLIANLPPTQKGALDAYTLLAGKVAGVPDSWVRLTVVGSELHGAVWDGDHLYAIAPAREMRNAVAEKSLAAGDGTLLYRLDDVQWRDSPPLCGVGPGHALETNYPKLTAELRENAAAAVVVDGQLHVEFIADFEFFQAFSTVTQGEMLARVNIVDGIFAEQVGIAITPHFRVFSAADDPFVASDGENLLDELAAYREATPAVRERGLAHLITGRDLTGQTAGIAFIGSLCQPAQGVSLSEGRFGALTSSIIIAHELGHNFGAPHDAEEGSACEATSTGFLMQPFVGSSSTFSDCSLAQMQPVVAAAACIEPIQFADGELIGAQVVPAFFGETIDYPIDVEASGALQLQDARVELDPGNGLSLVAAQAEGGTCTLSPGTGNYVCTLGNLASGTTRRIVAQVNPNFATSGRLQATLTATNDRFAFNSTLFSQFSAVSGTALQVISPTSISGLTRELLSFSGEVRASGQRPARNVAYRLSQPIFLTVVSITSTHGTCAPVLSEYVCNFGDLAPGTNGRVDVQVRGSFAGASQISQQATASNLLSGVGSAVGVNLTAAADVAALRSFTPLPVPLNQPFEFEINASSIGPQAIQDVVLTTTAGVTGFPIESITGPGVACTIVGSFWRCPIGTLAPGAVARFTVRARATQAGRFDATYNLEASNDDNSSNQSGLVRLDVRHPVDIELQHPPRVSVFEGRTVRSEALLTARGMATANNVRVTATLPSAVNVAAATLSGGTCSITPQSVTCTRASMPADVVATLTVDLVGTSQTGQFFATVTATADEDGEAQNSSRQQEIIVRPFFDLRLVPPPTDIPIAVGGTVNLDVDIASGPRALSNARFAFQTGGGVFVESMTLPGTSCTFNNINEWTCTLASFAANTTARVSMRVRAPSQQGPIPTHMSVFTSPDDDQTNNQAQVTWHVGPPPDASIQIEGPATLAATTNQAFPLIVNMILASTAPVADARIDLVLPSAVTVQSLPSGGPCQVVTGGARCDLGNVTPSSPNTFHFNLVASSAGDFTIEARFAASNDADAQNNVRTVALRVRAPAPPPSGNDDGGGGGGGGLGLATLCALGWLLLKRRFRATTHPITQ